MKNRIYFSLCVAALSTNAHGAYDLQRMSKQTGLSQQTVNNWMREFQWLEDSHEKFSASYYGTFSRIINTYNLKRGCEVGVAYGGHACDILTKTKVETLYCIDPYAAEFHPHLAQAGVLELYFLRVKTRMSDFGNRVYILRDYSLSAANRFQDNELDFVFIDADHTYESTKADIVAWYQKVRVGGILGGDDYATQWPGVPQAVNEFVAEYNLTLHIDEAEPRIWWIQKP
jgi:predicted O-methyltransferase YrrM